MGISQKQMKILAFPYTDYTALICDGAVRSGKTSIMTIAFVDWAMRSFNGCSFVLAGKTVKSCQRNLVNPYMGLYQTKKKYNVKFRVNDNVMTVEQGDVKNTFYIFGGRDESSYSLIQGITASGILLDEVALMPRSFVEQAIARTLSVPTKKLWFNCNPETPNHWFYNEWVKKCDEKKALHLHFLLEDNPVFTNEMIEETKQLYTGVFYDRYILGKWVTANGIVFPNFASNPAQWLIEKESLHKKNFEWVEAGFDIGGNKSAYAFTITAKGYDEVYYCLYSKKTQASDLDMAEVENIVNEGLRVVREHFKVHTIDYINTDHVDVIINHLNRNTIHQAGKTYKPPLEDRPFVFSMLFSTNRFLFVEEFCSDAIAEFKNLVYNEKAEKAIVLDDGSMQIDTWDSVVYSIAGDWKNAVERNVI